MELTLNIFFLSLIASLVNIPIIFKFLKTDNISKSFLNFFYLIFFVFNIKFINLIF